MKIKKAGIEVWNDVLLVNYTNKNGDDSSFTIESLKDIKCLKKELIEAGYVKRIEHWQQ